MSKRKKVAVKFTDKHLTKQDHGGGADIPAVAAQYLSGALPYPTEPPASYGDISEVDIQESRNILAEVRGTFDALPSDLRSHFENDPANYYAFLEENAPEIDSGGFSELIREIVHPVNKEAEQIAQNAQNEAAEADPSEAESTINPT